MNYRGATASSIIQVFLPLGYRLPENDCIFHFWKSLERLYPILLFLIIILGGVRLFFKYRASRSQGRICLFKINIYYSYLMGICITNNINYDFLFLDLHSISIFFTSLISSLIKVTILRNKTTDNRLMYIHN